MHKRDCLTLVTILIISSLMFFLFSNCGGGGSDTTDPPGDTPGDVTGDPPLETDSSTISIPDNTFSDGTSITASEGGVTYDGPGTALGNVITLSATQKSLSTGDGYTVAYDLSDYLPDADASQVLAESDTGDPVVMMIKVAGSYVEGGGFDPTSWYPASGNFNSSNGTFTTRLYAAAETLHIVPVRRDDLTISHNTRSITDTSTSSSSQHTIQAGATSSTWLNEPWAISYTDSIVCCEESELENIHAALLYASRKLYSDGQFTMAFLDQGTRTYAQTVGETVSITSDGDEYNMAFIDEDPECDGDSACYDVHSGKVYLSDLKAGAGQSELNRLFAHEIFHAVQRAYAPKVAKESNFDLVDWVLEGSADYISYGSVNDIITEKSPEGYRDYSYPLYKRGTTQFSDTDLEYLVAPYWAWASGGGLE